MVAECIGRCQHTIIVADEKLGSTSQLISDHLLAAGYRTSQLTVPSGEGSKSLEQAGRLWQALLEERTDRGVSRNCVGWRSCRRPGRFHRSDVCARIAARSNSNHVAQPG